jgi:hypothetical protein
MWPSKPIFSKTALKIVLNLCTPVAHIQGYPLAENEENHVSHFWGSSQRKRLESYCAGPNIVVLFLLYKNYSTEL